MMRVDISKMKHLKDKSHYNYNFYTSGNMGIELLQICHEEYNTYDYYLIDGDNKVFLGSAEESDEQEINFMYKYT